MKVDPGLGIYPPRPLGSINPVTVDQYDGYWAQYKYDDIRIIIRFLPGGDIEILSRKLVPLESYHLPPNMKKSLRKLKLSKKHFHLIDGGLIGRQGKDSEKIIVIWDILVHENEYLLDSTYSSRYKLLKKIAGNPLFFETHTGLKLARCIDGNLWLPKIYTSDFGKRFKRTFKTDLLEGLILKDPKGTLDWGAREENNGNWQIRVRKKTERHVY